MSSRKAIAGSKSFAYHSSLPVVHLGRGSGDHIITSSYRSKKLTMYTIFDEALEQYDQIWVSRGIILQIEYELFKSIKI